MVFALYPYFDGKLDGMLYETRAVVEVLLMLIRTGMHIKTLEFVLIIGSSKRLILKLVAPLMEHDTGLYTFTPPELVELKLQI